MPRKKKQTFENAMEELEGVIKALEQGELTLEESIESYQKGMTLATYCSDILEKAEQQVYILEEDEFKKSNGVEDGE